MGNNNSKPLPTPSSSGNRPVSQTKKLPRGRSLDLPDLMQPGTQYQTRSQPLEIPTRSTENSRNEFRQPQPNHELDKRLGKRVQRQADVETPAASASPSDTFLPTAPAPTRNATATSILEEGSNIIRSSIPMLLHLTHTAAIPEKIEPVPGHRHIEQKIYWQGGGSSVVLTSDSASVQTMMDRESLTTFSTTVPFLPGTHDVRFTVDGELRIADDLQSAVNDQGILVNYIIVDSQDHTTSPARTHSPPTIVNSQTAFEGGIFANLAQLSLGRSFWSGSSDADGHDPDSSDAFAHYAPQWTTEIPLELIQAAKEEEVYVAYADAFAQQNEMRHRSGDTRHVEQGFVPLPNIPPAPCLPRYLEKVILNQNLAQSVQGSHDRRRDREKQSMRDKDRAGDRESKNVHLTNSCFLGGPLPVTTASGTDVTNGARLSYERMVPVMEALEEPPSSSEAAALTLAAISDDSSVLTVPSHAVLNHLSTSAIKDGVLAVATTVRYKQKYGTLIYFKSA